MPKHDHRRIAAVGSIRHAVAAHRHDCDITVGHGGGAARKVQMHDQAILQLRSGQREHRVLAHTANHQQQRAHCAEEARQTKSAGWRATVCFQKKSKSFGSEKAYRGGRMGRDRNQGEQNESLHQAAKRNYHAAGEHQGRTRNM